MRLGAFDYKTSRIAQCAPPIGNAAWDAWREEYQRLHDEAAAFTNNNTQHTRTRKYYFMRAEIAKQWAREPLTRCQLDAQKGARKISDAQAVNEIRGPRITLANEWTARATKEERNEQIQIAATVAAIATAGAAALAAAGTAGGITSAAGLQAAGGSLLGAAPGASVKQLATVAVKKVAMKFGVEEAMKLAASEYARYQNKKMTKAQEKALAAELAAVEKEYAELLAQGKTPAQAEAVASKSGGGNGMLPLGLAVLLFKALA